MLALGELEKKTHFLILCYLLQKDRVVFQTNLLVIWSSATFFDIFFLSKFLQAKVVMVVLRIGLINRSNVLLHSRTNTSLFSSTHLNKVKVYFSTSFGAGLPMLNKKSLLSCFEKGFTVVLITIFNLLR